MRYITDGQRHLVCYPYSIPNLHEMASKLGLDRGWFHKNHYDIPVRRVEEIEAKCEKVRPRELLDVIKGNWAPGE